MSDLPTSRVTPSRPFTHTGVDFGGPIYIREGKRRNATKIKSYIALFVCFATKAIHLELVADLSTECFMGALKRFIARRGRPSKMYSDNGTNFVGAANVLSDLYEFLAQEQVKEKISSFATQENMEWIFIPPHSPHFGGIWEAGIKSAKYHLARIVADASLNYDEMSTVLAEIESVLNSRPITVLSEDPNDLRPLTPGHFLIGDSLKGLPQANVTDINVNRLSRWQRVEQIRQHFWNRWSVEDLNSLQVRPKWKTNKGEQLEIGKVVLVQQPGLAPLQWLLGRIQSVQLSKDGLIRSAVVKTSKGLMTRPITKISILPIDSPAT